MDLVIGSTSQLSHYFPENYIKISSRNIDFNYLKSEVWDSVYITFSEQRVKDNQAYIDYITPNFIYTLNIIDSLLENSSKIVCYTSCELFNKLSGIIYNNTEPDFIYSEYNISKLLLLKKVKERQKIDPRYNKVIFIHPFYFNSVYRSQYFLFGKIFNSIINKKQIQIGNIDFCRDMVHTSFVVKQSIEATQDMVLGSGKLFNVRAFVKDLYRLNDMDFYSYVKEDMLAPPSGRPKLIMAKVDWDYTYQNLLDDTQRDIVNYKI